MTCDAWLFALALAWSLTLAALVLVYGRLRRVSAQLAVLTLRVLDMVDTLDTLEKDLRT